MNNITSLKLKLNFGMISRLIGFRVALFVKPLTYVINKRIIENLIHNKNDITIKCKSICQITLELSLLNIESPKWIVLYFNNLIPSFTDNNPFPTRQFLLIKSPHIHHHHLESIYWIWHHVCISCRYIKSIFNPRTDLLPSLSRISFTTTSWDVYLHQITSACLPCLPPHPAQSSSWHCTLSSSFPLVVLSSCNMTHYCTLLLCISK